MFEGSSNLLGLLAGLLTTAAFVPQVLKVIKTNDTKSLSLSMYIVFTLGIFLWGVYGIQKNDVPIMLANAVTIVLALIILTKKIQNDVLQK
ncbi:MAG: SemiSWEET transporter [Robiginitomaculum sp.]|nr:SemiSWEET transporter [Robiginitomaculum sp.]